jgi:hypothetical protein
LIPETTTFTRLIDRDRKRALRVSLERGETDSLEPELSTYPADRLFEEVAFVAYHFNWAHDDVLAMPHWERRRWCEEISTINEKMNEGETPTKRPGASDGVDLSKLF